MAHVGQKIRLGPSRRLGELARPGHFGNHGPFGAHVLESTGETLVHIVAVDRLHHSPAPQAAPVLAHHLPLFAVEALLPQASADCLTGLGIAHAVTVKDAHGLAGQFALAVAEQPLHRAVAAQDHALACQHDADRGRIQDRLRLLIGKAQRIAHRGQLGGALANPALQVMAIAGQLLLGLLLFRQVGPDDMHQLLVAVANRGQQHPGDKVLAVRADVFPLEGVRAVFPRDAAHLGLLRRRKLTVRLVFGRNVGH